MAGNLDREDKKSKMAPKSEESVEGTDCTQDPSSTWPDYVSTIEEAEQVTSKFENQSTTMFFPWKCPKDFGKLSK